jgi:hypothetical protein
VEPQFGQIMKLVKSIVIFVLAASSYNVSEF